MKTEIKVEIIAGLFVILGVLIAGAFLYHTAPEPPEPPAPDFILYPYGWQTPEIISIPSNITVNGKGTEMILGIKNVGTKSGFYNLGIGGKNLTVEEFLCLGKIFGGTTGKAILYEDVKIAPSSTHEYHFYINPIEKNIEEMPLNASIHIVFSYWYPDPFHECYFEAVRYYNFDKKLKCYTKIGEDVICDEYIRFSIEEMAWK